MKNLLFALSLVFLVDGLRAQDSLRKIYELHANAEKDIAGAVQEAKAEHKHVLLQDGGNWCS